MFRPTSLFVKLKDVQPSNEWLLKFFANIRDNKVESTPNGIWCNDNVDILDPKYIELVSNYQRYFVQGEDVKGEVSIDNFNEKYAPLTPENFTTGKVVKNKPQITKEKLAKLSATKIKNFVKAGSKEFQDAIDLRKKKDDMIDEILTYHGVNSGVKDETISSKNI